jgi:hypothetical protein
LKDTNLSDDYLIPPTVLDALLHSTGVLTYVDIMLNEDDNKRKAVPYVPFSAEKVSFYTDEISKFWQEDFCSAYAVLIDMNENTVVYNCYLFSAQNQLLVKFESLCMKSFSTNSYNKNVILSLPTKIFTLKSNWVLNNVLEAVQHKPKKNLVLGESYICFDLEFVSNVSSLNSTQLSKEKYDITVVMLNNKFIEFLHQYCDTADFIEEKKSYPIEVATANIFQILQLVEELTQISKKVLVVKTNELEVDGMNNFELHAIEGISTNGIS